MKRFVNNNRGFTLIEVLATTLITTIIIGTIYGVFTMGIKSYKKIGIEGELRDEANYVIASVLSEIYKLSPDSIEGCGSNCFKVVNTMELKANELISSDGRIVGYRLKEQIKSNPTDKKELTIKLANDSIIINNGSSNITLNSDDITIDKDLSSIGYQCTNLQPEGSCLNAIIEFNLYLQNKNHKEPSSLLYVPPHVYHSSIGF